MIAVSKVTAQAAIQQATDARDHQFAVLELNSRKYAIEYAIAAREGLIQEAVASEPDPENEGKKRYTNDVARKAEFLRRRDTDTDIQKMQQELTEVNREIGEHAIEEKFASRMVRVLCAFAQSGNTESVWDEE